MDSDDRFKHLVKDPRFKTLRRKQRQVQIDDRFKSMFTDEKFTLKYKQDKRGRKPHKTKPDSEEEEDDDDDEVKVVEDKKESEVVVGECEEADDDATSSSSSSDESDSEGPESEADDLVERIQYDWQPLDHDAERADTITKRIAIQNLDWNHLDVKDIYTLVNSIRPPLSVKIYVSEFGKERLAKEEVEGPQELADMPQIDEEEEEYQQLEEKMHALESKDKRHKANEYEDADEIIDAKNEEIRERLRRYQLSQMKYYYAIVEFDSPESAQTVYKELDGIEYEGSSLELDLRYVPDDMEFDPADVKAECDKVPDLATYKAPQFINSALQQTTVKFTWDETDVKRQEKLHKAYTKQELEKDDLEAYLASETDSDEEEEEDGEDPNGDKSETMTTMTGNSEARVNKYRELLKSLDEEAERKKKAQVDVEWGDFDSASGAAEEQDEDDESDDADDSDEVAESEEAHGSDEAEESDEAYSEEEEEEEEEEEDRAAKSTKRAKARRPKRSKRKQAEMEPDPDLDLLVMDARDTKQDDFRFNPDDDRFKAVYESGLYNIDPSHPNFKRSEAFNQIAERKRDKRRKRNQ